MKKIILITLFSVAALFAQTETINLTGKYSEQLGNPFKRVLNTNKTETKNIFSETKDVVLKVDSNLENKNFTIKNQHPNSIILKNKSVENVVEDFYSEDFIVNRAADNAVAVNILKGSVYLTYTNEEENGALIGVEVKLTVSVNGKEKEIVMDQNVEKPVAYRGHVTADDFDFNKVSLTETVNEIIENIIYKGLK